MDVEFDYRIIDRLARIVIRPRDLMKLKRIDITYIAFLEGKTLVVTDQFDPTAFDIQNLRVIMPVLRRIH